MKGLHSQKGLSFYSIVFLVAFVGFAAVCVMKIVPIYLDHSTLKSIVKQLDNDTALDVTDFRVVRQAVSRRLQVNSVKVDLDEEVSYSLSETGTTVVTLNYERRIPLFPAIGLDVVVWFDDDIELH